MSELEKSFAGKVACSNEDATTPANAQINKDLGFRSHGLVIYAADGTVLWKQADHSVKVEEAKAFLEKYLQSSS